MKEISVALIGGGFISKAHCLAFRALPGYFPELSVRIRRKVLVEVDGELAKKKAEELGFEKWTTSWQEAINDPEISLVDILTPNYLHKPIALYAAEQGKNIFCEKPLATSAADAQEMYAAVEKSDVNHMVGLSFRYSPSLRQIERWIKQGELGEIRHFHGVYCQEWGAEENTPLDWHFQSKTAGSGSLGDIGTHIIDIARAFAGDFQEVVAVSNTFVKERPLVNGSAFLSAAENSAPATSEIKKGPVDVDDSVFFLSRFKNGALGDFVLSRAWRGRPNHLAFEINGTKGSIVFDWDESNKVQFFSTSQAIDKKGFTRVLIGNAAHPYHKNLWPIAGCGVGFAENYIIEIYELLQAIVTGKKIDTSFYEGWKACQVVDAVLQSDRERRWIAVQ